MGIKEKLEYLLTYYLINRGIGHSRLLNEGVKNYPKDKFVLCSTLEAGDHLNLRRSEIVTLRGIENGSMRSHSRPLVIDNSALLILFEESITTISELQGKVHELSHHEEIIEGLKKDLKKQKSNVSILKSLLKNSMKEIEEKNNKIIKMENHPFKTFIKSVYGNISKSTSRRKGRNEGRGSKSGGDKVDGGRKVRPSSGS